MPDGVPNVIVFVGDWNRDTFNDVVDVLDAGLSKWGSVFRYGLTMLFPWQQCCLAAFDDLGDFNGEIFGTEIATFNDHVLLVGFGLLLMCFTFLVAFCFLCYSISPSPHPRHMSQLWCNHSDQSYDRVPVFALIYHYLRSSTAKTFWFLSKYSMILIWLRQQ